MAQLTYCAMRERLESMTPLGRDSVPEVYINLRGSSSAIGTSGSPGFPPSIQLSTSSQLSAAPAPESGIQPRTPLDIPAAAIACSAVGASASSVISPAAPE